MSSLERNLNSSPPMDEETGFVKEDIFQKHRFYPVEAPAKHPFAIRTVCAMVVGKEVRVL